VDETLIPDGWIAVGDVAVGPAGVFVLDVEPRSPRRRPWRTHRRIRRGAVALRRRINERTRLAPWVQPVVLVHDADVPVRELDGVAHVRADACRAWLASQPTTLSQTSQSLIALALESGVVASPTHA
jgi:hypothetical protein